MTRGGEGVDLYTRPGPPWHIPAFPADVKDTTGAGDAFSGALAWALSRGVALREAVAAAAAAGALATRCVGARASLPDQAQIDRLLEQRKAAVQ